MKKEYLIRKEWDEDLCFYRYFAYMSIFGIPIWPLSKTMAHSEDDLKPNFVGILYSDAGCK